LPVSCAVATSTRTRMVASRCITVTPLSYSRHIVPFALYYACTTSISLSTKDLSSAGGGVGLLINGAFLCSRARRGGRHPSLLRCGDSVTGTGFGRRGSWRIRGLPMAVLCGRSPPDVESPAVAWSLGRPLQRLQLQRPRLQQQRLRPCRRRRQRRWSRRLRLQRRRR
jgi:hypothetical protein